MTAEGPHPEYQEYAADLSTVDLGRLKEDLARFNTQFSSMRRMAEMLGRHISGENAVMDAQTQAKEQRFSLEELVSKNGEVLARTGLSLEPVNGSTTLYTKEGEILPSSEMGLNLADRDRFLAYLEALQPETLTDSQALGLETVAETLTKQLTTQYNLDNPADDRMIELLSGLGKIVDQYDRLDPKKNRGLQAAIEQLRIYAEIGKAKYLREYLLVEKSGILAEVGGPNFGPSNWHTDSEPASYRIRWQQALEVLRIVQSNPNAATLAKQLQSNLVASLEYARKDLEQSESSHIVDSREHLFLDVLEEFAAQLENRA